MSPRNPYTVLSVCLLTIVLCIIGGYLRTSRAGHHSYSATSAPTPDPNIAAVKCGTNKADTMTKCHANYPGGCNYSQNPQYDAYLNSLKNLLISPTENPDDPVLTKATFLDLEKNTPLDLTSNNHSSKRVALQNLGEGKIRKLVGYLYYAFPSNRQGEACNCNLTSDDAVDFHIGIGFSPFPLNQSILQELRNGANLEEKKFDSERPTLQQNSAVVEITPHYRAQLEPNWTIGRVQRATGRQVMIVGQLLVDNAHLNTKDNCNYRKGHDSAKCWRFSAWEIHPITGFYVCSKATPCSDTSPAGWVKLENTPQ